MYYGDIFPDPVDVDRIYVPDVIFQVSDDGGKTLRSLGTRNMHVDNHIIWVDPDNTNHMMVGNDGGLYRSFDHASTWIFFENLPLAQYYDVDVDNASPFYNVYGGLQDNNSLGGPSRTRSEHGILNQDWFVTQGGDGFVSRVDPEDPNTVYAELQHGVIVRFDKRTGERIGIQPQEEKGGTPLRWNWDSPFIISPHSHTRLYFAAQMLFRSDDRGNSWKAARRISRGRSIAKRWRYGSRVGPRRGCEEHVHRATANIRHRRGPARRLAVSAPDDGLIHVTEDAGAHWRKITMLARCAQRRHVARIRASQHDAATVTSRSRIPERRLRAVSAQSTDSGKPCRSPRSAGARLDLRHRQDHVDPRLLFAGH
jgi:hypothetical protein